MQFTMLHPHRDAAYEGNDSSCVLRIEAGGQSILLSGDIERAAEAQLVRDQPEQLASDVLVAPHHGSRSSSTAAFVAAVSPTIVLYSAGHRSQFGHPSAEVVQRYEASGTVTYNTALSGALTLRLGGESALVPPQEFRQTHRRYWFARATPESARLHGVDIQGEE
ncbi:MAG: hypothetical protein A3H44_08940 [Gammaproteobacteria bacterium RIFCSPLOWO2_02_FULL_57_10]|nr:MAG: hypothetical protein A3H44_08940 [Gammaproteobacteria bacterium RIFCSPLOWO2_02_FULL_57_10]